LLILCVHIETSSLWAEFVNKNRCISVRLVSEEVKSLSFDNSHNSFHPITRIFHWFSMCKMDPMSRIDIRLVFTLPPRDCALQYKRCVHPWNSFPCIITLGGTIYWSQRNYWILTDNILPDQNELWTRIETIMNLPHKKKWIKTIITLKRKIFNYVFSDTLTERPISY